MSLPRIKPAGPIPAKLMILGDCPGTSEALLGRPFLGSSGQELKKMCAEAGLNFSEAYLTYVFLSQPPKNNVDYFLVPTKVATPKAKTLGPAMRGKYINEIFLDEMQRLQGEISSVSPNVIIALGNIPLWALTGKLGIGSYRGVADSWQHNPDTIVLPTYHPASVLSNWQMRSIVVADLAKAARLLNPSESQEDAEILNIKINPTLQEIEAFVPLALISPYMAIDVETKAGQIRTISFSLNSKSAFVIPFWDSDVSNYWPTLAEETRALELTRQILQSPAIKIFQNGTYDIQYIWKTWGIPIAGTIEDTMLIHHALQPELQKGLGFLGSIYLDRGAWKQWRREHAEKKDD